MIFQRSCITANAQPVFVESNSPGSTRPNWLTLINYIEVIYSLGSAIQPAVIFGERAFKIIEFGMHINTAGLAFQRFTGAALC